MWYGGIVLDVYCDQEDDYHLSSSHNQYVGGTLDQARKEARRDGWIFHKDGKMTCPTCKKRKK